MLDTYETILSELDLRIIQQVKLLRDSHELSQRDLSIKMGLSESFVGKVESLSQPDKYSIRHLTLLAKSFDLQSVIELFPQKIPKNDFVKVTFRKIPKMKKDGTVSKFFEEEIIKVEKI